MSSAGPWSVKGIDPRARAAAKEAAQRRGMTIGEWLSEKMLEPNNNSMGGQNNDPRAGQSSLVRDMYPGPRFGSQDDYPSSGRDASAAEIEALAKRLEATEHRSTLAITGIDQSVLGLLARLENIEQSQKDVEANLASSLHSLETRLHEAEESSEEFAAGLSRSLKDVTRRVDSIAERSETANSTTRHELGKDVELINTRSDEISQRLADAERHTDNAIRSLEASFSSLETRLKDAEISLQDNSNTGLTEMFEERFSLISNELVKVVAETRGQLAAQIQAEAANPKLKEMDSALGEMRERLAGTENRHANTLERIAVEVSKLGGAVESRLRATDEKVDKKFDALRQEQADALDKVGHSMTEVVERLEARFEKADEDRNAGDELEARLRDSEARTGQMVEAALQRLHQRLDDAEDQSEAAISPVQRALNSLTERLNALEDRSAPPFSDFDEALTAPHAASGTGNSAEPAQSARAPAARWDDTGNIGTPGELVTPPPQAGSGMNFDGGVLPPLNDDQFAAHNQMAGGYTPEMADYAAQQAQPASQEMPRAASGQPQTDRPIGATADASFMAAARRSVLTGAPESGFAYPAGPVAPGAPALKPKKEGRNRTLLMAASIVALVAVFGAAGMALLDIGGNKGNSGYQLAKQDGITNDSFLNGSQTTDAPDSQMADAAASNDVDMDGQEARMANAGDGTAASSDATPAPAPAVKVEPKPVTRKPAAHQEPQYQPPARTQVAKRQSTPSRSNSKPKTQTAIVHQPKTKPIEMASAHTSERPAAPVIHRPGTSQNVHADRDKPVVLGAGRPVDLSTGSSSSRPTMEQAAQAGDPVALYQYAQTLLDTGDTANAFKEMKQAAERGLPAAQYQLAKYYENGSGTAKNEQEARRWIERAANGGNRRAMHNLAMYYAEGRTVPQSYETAAKWFEQASLLGLTNSEFNLALLYEQGLGVPKSLPDAYVWYAIAANAGDRGAEQKMQALKSQLPADAVKEAETIVARFKPRPLDLAANGVFRNVNWARAQTGGPQAISRAQILLSRLGYDPGPVDGNMGDKTRLAVIAYERDNNLAQTGKVDGELLAKLEKAAIN